MSATQEYGQPNANHHWLYHLVIIVSGKLLDFSLPFNFLICNMRIKAHDRTDRIKLENIRKASGAQLVLSPRASAKLVLEAFL